MNEYQNDVNEETGLNDLLECEGKIMREASDLFKMKPTIFDEYPHLKKEIMEYQQEKYCLDGE